LCVRGEQDTASRHHSFVLLDTFSKENHMNKKCLFPVAGYGTRFLPATKSMPKEMLPIVNKPLVQYGVEEAIEAGLREIALVTGRGKRAIADPFDICYELEHQIAGTGKEKYLASIRNVLDKGTFTMTRQREMKGLGHAILTGEVLVGSEPFGVILSDDLCLNESGPGVMAQMAALFRQFRCSIVAVQEVPMDQIEKYGVIAGEPLKDALYRVDNMVEKPKQEDAPSNLAIIGRYILTPDIFDILRETPPGKNGEVQLTDALLTQARNGCVMAYKFKGRRFDCGSVDGFVEATNYVYQNLYEPL
jgi:UTP--glucose-1-phosphate uridylyltransferase